MSGIPNHSVQSLIISNDTVPKIFIITLFVVNSNDFSCFLLIGQASSAYNKHGIHLELINWRTTSTDRKEIHAMKHQSFCQVNKYISSTNYKSELKQEG